MATVANLISLDLEIQISSVNQGVDQSLKLRSMSIQLLETYSTDVLWQTLPKKSGARIDLIFPYLERSLFWTQEIWATNTLFFREFETQQQRNDISEGLGN
jgi:hypothetical protein